MANTQHTGIPRLQWIGAYPPCVPSCRITVDINPFCAGESITFIPELSCVGDLTDTVKNGALYNWPAVMNDGAIKYGALYNFPAVIDLRLICADGWEVPSKAKWTTMIDYVGGLIDAQTELKSSDLDYWESGYEGTNLHGLNVRGGGQRYAVGTFANLKTGTSIHSSSMNIEFPTLNERLDFRTDETLIFQASSKNVGCYIRPIKTTTSLTHGQTGTYTGNDGKKYRTICIGTQEWLADNLAETKFRNGDDIPIVTDNAEWAALETAGMCYYDNDITYSQESLAERIAPTGWHLLKRSEVMDMITTLEGEEAPEGDGYTCGGKMKETGFIHWDSPNTGATNESGFSGVGAGERIGVSLGDPELSGVFLLLKQLTRIWIINDLGAEDLIESCNLAYNSANLIFDDLALSTGGASSGLSVRLVMDDPEGYTEGDTFTDNDGNVYPLVKIGDIVVMAENLRTTSYPTGYFIPNVTDNELWAEDTFGAMCYYDNDILNSFRQGSILSYAWYVNGVVVNNSGSAFVTNELTDGDTVRFSFTTITGQTYFSNAITVFLTEEGCIEDIKYGPLYNWYATTDGRNITADGWEVPSAANISTFITYLGGDSVAGGKLKETGFIYFDSPNDGATNEAGFNARGSGYRKYSPVVFEQFKKDAYYWASNSYNTLFAYGVFLTNINDNTTQFNLGHKTSGYSLRLIKTTTTLSDGETGTYTGNDGKVYRTICIGTQEWLADNLAETKFRNGDDIPIVTDNSEWAALETAGMCAYNNDWDNV